jgi:carbon-monoxide dehydrogenase large subunit
MDHEAHGPGDRERGTHGERNDSRRRVGTRTNRREDRRLLTGSGQYTDDRGPSDVRFLSIHRSSHGHADVERIDTAQAESRDGVLGVYTWDDIEASRSPGVIGVPTERLDVAVPGHPILARDRVRYHGQPIAAVVATDRYVAADAASSIEVEYDRRPSVVDPAEATADGAPTLFEGAPDNVAATAEIGDRADTAAAFESAPHTVEVSLTNNRLIPNAIEPRAALARYDPGRDHLTLTVTSQSPHGHRAALSETLGLAERNVQVVAPDVGGGFGHKGVHYPGDALAAWCAMRHDRPVKWTATRSENYLAGGHGRDHRTNAELAVDDDGEILGLRVETQGNTGGYSVQSGALRPISNIRLVSGQYRIPAVHYDVESVFTNTAPIESYRGAGRPEATYVVERLIDIAADELDVDPAELRRRNQIPPDAFPYETATGLVYDSGDYRTALETVLDELDYPALRERQESLRAEGRYLGVGFGSYVEGTGSGYQSGSVRVHPSGDVTVFTSAHAHGQGHETTFAQIVADELTVDVDEVSVVQGDTDRIPTGKGTSGSRSTVLAGNAVARSAVAVARKARRIAAHRLEAAEADVVRSAGEFHVDGAPTRSVAFADVAAEAYGGEIPDDVDPGLEETTFYEAEGTAFSFGTHAAVVEVDPDTGELEIRRYLAVDDCGERINPMLVEGQIHGGVAQGIGQARYEQTVYDENGTLVTGTLQNYAVPKAEQIPAIETEATVTPSPRNPLGVKGIGEAGTTAAPPAVVNAVVDALEPFGVDHLDMPLTDEKLWQAVTDADS